MPMPAAPSSVLLLGWDATSAAPPLARQLAPTTATELWTAVPLATTADVSRSRSLDVAPPLPAVLPELGRRAPAFPYLGRDAGQPVAVPAAPYVGSSEVPAEAAPSTTNHFIHDGVVQTAAEGSFTAPAPPYVGAAPHAGNALLTAPVPDYRVPVAALPALPPRSVATVGPAVVAASVSLAPVAADTPAAETAPAAAAELAAKAAALVPAAPSTSPADPAPTPTAVELLPEPAAAAPPAGPAPAADDTVLLAAAPDAAGLNFRIIQYARHAARLAYESSFEVIFAPDWHTWLAGVELRQLTRRPLVLQVTQLATDLASPAERGWVEALERITLPQADRILVPDDATAARLRQRYRQLADRVQVLPAGAPELASALVLDSRFSQ